MSISTQQAVSVGTSAVKLLAAPAAGDYLPGYRGDILNQGAVTLVIGGPGVTATTGFRLAAGAAWGRSLDPGEEIWGITAASTTTADTIESGV